MLLESISESEYPNIFEDAFSRYVVDENRMFRYAKRRKANPEAYAYVVKTDRLLSTLQK